jgi:hypothetical protein
LFRCVSTTLSLLGSVFDRNGTGTIPAAEFLSFSKVLGEPFTEKEREFCVHVCSVRYWGIFKSLLLLSYTNSHFESPYFTFHLSFSVASLSVHNKSGYIYYEGACTEFYFSFCLVDQFCVTLLSSASDLNTLSLSTLLHSFIHSFAFLSFPAELIKVIRGKPIAKPAPAKGKK